jgi:hypothetical protein
MPLKYYGCRSADILLLLLLLLYYYYPETVIMGTAMPVPSQIVTV